ncbi:type II toxin-antitoxin system MqsA family antitoxin [Pseudomonas sp. App30]|uniref:type II toxin-antitoxin system MqsA family antitoxin n=1 Tax=Pseudomonas sp. App30 TaxID=3068990 RepID=UPI003A7FFAA9
MKCPICSHTELVSGIFDLPYTYKGKTTYIVAVHAERCARCEEIILGAQESQRVSESMLAFRKFDTLVGAGLPASFSGPIS